MGKVTCLGERPSGNTTVKIYHCPICGSEFICGATEVIYCDKCGAEFEPIENNEKLIKDLKRII